ncbi:AsnC family transcriptional regulator [Pseudorhodoferax soli]|uniref:AsnC family transcriptional regulator n=1 Tax=Pseudorhodoferax soli TaxID=545864 RepID=A0A368XKX3_9BURK|nr:AsnC family transcriptional regulator [Pseudorhodoferax soli]
MDEVDRKILSIVQDNGRLTNAELAERVSLSASPCWKRLRRLETTGVIRGYQAVLDRQLMGFGVMAFVNISLTDHGERTCRQFEAAITTMPEVVSCHNTTGQHDYLLHVIAADFNTYSMLVLNRLRALPGVKEILSSLSMRELKHSSKLPFATRR